MRNELLKSVWRDRFYIGQNINNGKVVVAEIGTDRIGGVVAAVLRLSMGENQVTWYVRPADGRLLRTVAQVPSSKGMVDSVVDYSDWRICDGLIVPFLETITQGEKRSQEEVLSVELNPNIPSGDIASPVGTPNSAQSPTWLHPSDAEYQQAIVKGPSGSGYRDLDLLGVWNQMSFTVERPLSCADQISHLASVRLETKPTIVLVKSACDGKILITMSAFSLSLNMEFNLVLEEPNGRLTASSATHDSYPEVTTGEAGGILNRHEEAGYQYTESYTFQPTQAWNQKLTLLWTNGITEHGKVNLDFTIFTKDEAKHRRGLP